jgi:hypothetical protein
MKFWNSASNAQGLRVIIVVVHVGAVKLSSLPKLVKKTSLSPSCFVLFCEIFIPNYTFDALLCWNWPFLPPNHVTLWITLILWTNLGTFVQFSGLFLKSNKKANNWILWMNFWCYPVSVMIVLEKPNKDIW